VIPRYTRPDMGRIWSDGKSVRTWLTVEVAATGNPRRSEAWFRKMRPKSYPQTRQFRLPAHFNEIEAEVVTTSSLSPPRWQKIVGPEARWFHYGLTSNDCSDTAQPLLIGQASLYCRRSRSPFGVLETPRLGI